MKPSGLETSGDSVTAGRGERIRPDVTPRGDARLLAVPRELWQDVLLTLRIARDRACADESLTAEEIEVECALTLERVDRREDGEIYELAQLERDLAEARRRERALTAMLERLMPRAVLDDYEADEIRAFVRGEVRS